jgi:exodeoxyribonuclease VII large subunit
VKLLEERLYDNDKKMPIPTIPCKIGVVTAPTGAVIRDIITTVERRWPLCEVILFPTLVQGDNAAKDIVRNIERANESDIDVLIVGRGGGSIEDLWPFNEEIVARSIRDSKIPIISAVGHETDTTIADLVADLRAPTPTAAAEMAVPDIFQLKKNLINYRVRCDQYITKKLNYLEMIICKMKASYVLKKPMVLYEAKLEKLGLINEKINNYIKDRIYNINKDLNNKTEKLIILNPMETLNRGYGIVKLEKNIISSVKDMKKKDIINTQLKDGIIVSEIKEIKENK